jgi:hypothetical protein
VRWLLDPKLGFYVFAYDPKFGKSGIELSPLHMPLDGIGADRELGGTQNYGRIEYAYHLMAKAAGIIMSPCRLLEENGRAH